MAVTSDKSEISTTEYAVHRKELLQLVKQLRAIGAQADIDLPRITVIGNQSAGKSSLVEAISGITVPRDAGTCTRCPMECRLSSSPGPWSCQVSIRWEFQESGKRSDEVSEVPFGKRITDKSDVELRLRQAQAAVLNPKVPASQFLGLSEKDCLKGIKSNKPLFFSRNVVCVDLEGPELTDLSFIDLPGLIQNAEDDVVKFVEDLVISHIKGNCLILVALPMTDDIDNLKALKLARKEDAAGDRTIGVMTKPDMLTSGSTKARELWLDVLEGRRQPLRHGYYCTRQPDDAERAERILSAEARSREADFFALTKPWAELSDQSRLGTANLVGTLSGLLVHIINSTLPKIQSEASTLLTSCTEQLTRIPPAVEGDPSTHMMTLITEFCRSIEQYAQGSPGCGRLIHENRDAWKTLQEKIQRTVPNFRPFVNRDQRGSTAFVNWLEEEKSEDAVRGDGQPVYLQDMRLHIQQSVTRELPDNVPFEAKVQLIKHFQKTWSISSKACFNHVRESTEKLLIDVVKNHFVRYDSLQIHLRSLVSELVHRHQHSCIQLLETVLEMEAMPFTQNTHYLESCTDKWLSRYRDARAGKRAVEVEQKQQSVFARNETPPSDPSPFAFGSRFSSGSTTVEKPSPGPDKGTAPKPPMFVAGEKGSLFPSNTSPFSSLNLTVPKAPSSSQVDPAKVRSALSVLAEIGYEGLVEEDLGKLNPPDEYETELRVMAEVRGYFQVTYKRIIDNVPSLIDLKFVRAVAKDLQPFLISKLELGTSSAGARCAKYLQEDPSVVARRDELLARKKRLESVAFELQNFGL